MFILYLFDELLNGNAQKEKPFTSVLLAYNAAIIIIIIHEFHRDASLKTKLQGR